MRSGDKRGLPKYELSRQEIETFYFSSFFFSLFFRSRTILLVCIVVLAYLKFRFGCYVFNSLIIILMQKAQPGNILFLVRENRAQSHSNLIKIALLV